VVYRLLVEFLGERQMQLLKVKRVSPLMELQRMQLRKPQFDS
jgi:hypothetical protein